MDEDISLLNHKVDAMSSVITDMKATLKELTTAITKLTLIEERQIHAAAALERAFKSIEGINNRIATLEQYVPANKRISIWIDRATWAGLGLLAMLLFKKSGLI